MKFYAVKQGRKTGIFTSWDEAKAQVDGYSGAVYKSFKLREQAEEFLNDTPVATSQLGRPVPPTPVNKTVTPAPTDTAASDFFATIYTDGGCRNTGNVKGGHVNADDKAAWAYLIVTKDNKMSDSNGRKGATNNEMELTALIEALKTLINLGYNEKQLHFVLDSQYVLKPITQDWLYNWKNNNWRKSDHKPIKNKEYWQELARLLVQFPAATFSWTKGHADNEGNEFVDSKLNEFMDKMI